MTLDLFELAELNSVTEPIKTTELPYVETNKAGMLYVMLYPSRLEAKIGITTRSIGKRLQEIRGYYKDAGVETEPGDIFPIYWEFLNEVKAKEDKQKELMDKFRFGCGLEAHITGKTEFYSVESEEMVEMLSAMCGKDVKELWLKDYLPEEPSNDETLLFEDIIQEISEMDEVDDISSVTRLQTSKGEGSVTLGVVMNGVNNEITLRTPRDDEREMWRFVFSGNITPEISSYLQYLSANNDF